MKSQKAFKFRMAVFFLLLAGAALNGSAAPVSQEQAERAVNTYLSRSPAPMGARMGSRSRRVRSFNRQNQQQADPLFHVVALEGGGFVVTSADTEVDPIIAISEGEDLIESEENHLWILLNRDLSQRMEALEAAAPIAPAMAAAAGGAGAGGAAAQASEPDSAPAPAQQWADLLAENADGSADDGADDGAGGGIAIAYPHTVAGESSINDVRVEPLVQSKWDQSTVGGKAAYNYYTPNNCVCGCVATAGAQVMRFHQHPTTSVTAGTHSCWVNNAPQNLTMKGGVYDWNNMPLAPTSSITDPQREAIGKLTYDVGVASRMSYSSGASSAYNFVMVDALKSTFGYASGFTHVIGDGTSSPGGNATIRNALLGTLDAGLPAVLGIRTTSNAGHSIVADGYGFKDKILYAHLNMGWGGSQDAWYNLQNFNVSTSYNFTLFDDVSFNISPTAGEYITGRALRSSDGAPLAGATVMARNTSNNATYTAVSNAKGVYAIKVPSASATYAISATHTSGNTTISTPSNVTTSTQASSMVDYFWYGTDGEMRWYTARPGIVGNRWGNDLALGPLAAPPPPAVVSASDGSSTTSVTVTWASSAGATSYKVFRRIPNDVRTLTIGGKPAYMKIDIDSTDNAQQIGTTSATSYNDSTAELGKVYNYWVKASNGKGDSAFSARDLGHRASSTTQHDFAFYPPDGWPAGFFLSSTRDGLNEIELLTSGTSAYIRYAFRDLNNLPFSGNMKTVFSVTVNGTVHVLTNTITQLQSGTVYQTATGISLPILQNIGGAGPYTISVTLNADKSAQEVDYTNNTQEKSMAILQIAPMPVFPPSNLTASYGDHTDRIALTWSHSLNIGGNPQYKIFRSAYNDSQTAAQIGTSTVTAYDDAAAPAGKTCYYWVKGNDGKSDSAFSAVASGLRAPLEYEQWRQARGQSHTPALYAKWLVNPDDIDAVFRAGIEIVNGAPRITWTPDLLSARSYPIEGKTNLTDSAWHSPTNSATRFYRVKVEMP